MPLLEKSPEDIHESGAEALSGRKTDCLHGVRHPSGGLEYGIKYATNIEDRKKDKPMGMDSLALFRRGAALYRRNRVVHPGVYAAGTLRQRDYLLRLVALSAVGHQTAVESVPRPREDETLVDCRHAAACRRGFRRCGLHGQHVAVASGDHLFLLAAGFQQRDARRGGRRLLYDGAQSARPGFLRRHTFYILPHLDGCGQGRTDCACRFPASGV